MITYAAIQCPMHVVAIRVKTGVHAEVKITVPRSVFTGVILMEGDDFELILFSSIKFING